MPTQDETPVVAPIAASALPAHATCPPEQDSAVIHTAELGQHQIPVAGPAPSSTVAVDAPVASSSDNGDRAAQPAEASSSGRAVPVEHPKFDHSQFPTSSPMAFPPAFPSPLNAPEPAPVPQSMPQHTSSFLRNGSKFVGTQQSDRQVYNVSVEIKHVDMRESFVCGYLRIEGLTPDHPTLTTYFEGEIIGTKYTFQTRHSEWGVNEKIDMQHWNRFPAWRPLARQAKTPNFSFKNYADREHLFMRWKEYFLVPNHRVTSISGASFEGFYYICFSQVSGSVSGIYFHSKSEKHNRFQQLELKHVHDYGTNAAAEFA